MQILHPFLLIIANSHKTQWYKVVRNNSMEKIDTLIEEKATFSDNEGHSRGGGASGGNLKTNEVWDEETRKHLTKTAEKTRELWNSAEYHSIVIAAPENMKNQITEAITVENTQTSYIPGNFTHHNLHQKLLEKIHEV